MRLVSSFSRGNQNSLGGYFNSFSDAGSSARSTIAPAPDGVSALRVDCERSENGFCGAWVHTFDFTVPMEDRWYLDASGFQYLAFWFRASDEVEVLIKVADAEWERKEDALPVGRVSEFVPGGRLNGEWAMALVPVTRFPLALNRSELASIVFEFASEGPGVFYVSEMAFLEDGKVTPPRPVGSPRKVNAGDLHRSTWIWNTSELITQENRRRSLIEMLHSEGFDQVYLQIFEAPGTSAIKGEIQIDESGLRVIVGELRAAGIDAYALDGFARYALREYHPGVLRTIDHLVEYNSRVGKQDQIVGIRYDIEPYLLPGFHGPARDSILTSFLDLLSEMQRRVSAAGLTFAVDIPFWYDARSRLTGEMVVVTYGGKTKPVSHHVIDIVDEVSVMAYRTTAYGADGVVRHASNELEYASTVDKKVMVAIETHPLPDEELFEIDGAPATGLPESSERGEVVVMLTKGDSVRVSIADLKSHGSLALERERAALQDGDYSDAFWWPVRRRIPVPADKLSFAKLGADKMRSTMREALPELNAFRSFWGFAVHHAESLDDLLKSEKAAATESIAGPVDQDGTRP